MASNLGSSWPIVFTAALSVVLYIYSPMLKGRGIAGNLAVSVCVAALLVWARMATGRPLDLAGSADQMWLLATVTLWGLNVTREWVKDLQDLEGDLAAGHRTWASQLTPRQNQGGLAFNVVVWSALGGTCVWLEGAHVAWLATWAVLLVVGAVRAWQQNVVFVSAWLKVAMAVLFAQMW